MQVEQFVMAYRIEQDRIRAMLPDAFDSLRPVLRINAEIRDETTAYIEFNTPVGAQGKKGWLNIAHWKTPETDIGWEHDGKRMRFHTEFLDISFAGTDFSGGCPTEKNNDGCFFRRGNEYMLIPPEAIDAHRDFCDCEFRWKFSVHDAHGVSIGEKTVGVMREDPRIEYPRMALSAETAASLPCLQMLGQYSVVFQRS